MASSPILDWNDHRWPLVLLRTVLGFILGFAIVFSVEVADDLVGHFIPSRYGHWEDVRSISGYVHDDRLLMVSERSIRRGGPWEFTQDLECRTGSSEWFKVHTRHSRASVRRNPELHVFYWTWPVSRSHVRGFELCRVQDLTAVLHLDFGLTATIFSGPFTEFEVNEAVPQWVRSVPIWE